MKVKIEMTFDIDPDAWRDEILADPDASVREVRRDVKSWVSAELGFALGDRGVLDRPATHAADVEIRSES